MIRWDVRLGGSPIRYISKPGRALVQVPQTMRKCVAFLACKQGGSMCLKGTVFFIGVPYKEISGFPTKMYGYAVTAKHVIDKIEEESDDLRVYFRLNKRTGYADFIAGQVEDWYFHPTDESTDVAVMPWPYAPIGNDHTVCSINDFVTDDVVKEQGIGPGEEVFLAGLFNRHAGTEKNIPVLRVGNIAAMPEEPIDTSLGLTEAYLIEVRSIGGLSGSPVFVHLGIVRHKEGQLLPARDLHRPIYLLGLMHGHWDANIPDVDIDRADKDIRQINMGMAVVIPGQKILETINRLELQQLRIEWLKEFNTKLAPTLD